MRKPLLVLCAVLWATALGAASDGLQVRGVDGRAFVLFAPKGAASAIFFVATDCPISNWYAPTIQQVCRDYAARGVDCTLVYEDVDLGARPTGRTNETWSDFEIRKSDQVSLDGAVRTHLREYGYGSVSATVDRTRAVATRARATVTPSVVLVDQAGAIRYRGRIDNGYADLGKPRQHVTSHDLRVSLDALLTGRQVPVPETDAVGCYIADPAAIRGKP